MSGEVAPVGASPAAQLLHTSARVVQAQVGALLGQLRAEATRQGRNRELQVPLVQATGYAVVLEDAVSRLVLALSSSPVPPGYVNIRHAMAELAESEGGNPD